MSESDLCRFAKKEMKSHGWYFVKTCPPIESGTPDLLCCVGGLFVGVELKNGKNQPSKLQLKRHSQIVDAGGLVYVPRTREEVRELIGEVNDKVNSGLQG